VFPVWVIPILILVIYFLSAIKILREYERGVIFRLGRILPHPKGPGIFLVFAPIELRNLSRLQSKCCRFRHRAVGAVRSKAGSYRSALARPEKAAHYPWPIDAEVVLTSPSLLLNHRSGLKESRRLIAYTQFTQIGIICRSGTRGGQ